MDSKGIKGRIVLAVSNKGITLSKLIADCQFNEQSFYRYMNGGREWTVDYLVTIAEYFEVNLDYLIKGVKLDSGGAHVVKKDIYTLQAEIELLKDENRELRGKLAAIIGLAGTKPETKRKNKRK